jgi:DNA polymerase III epsilon subunit family exonuclease
VNTDLSANIWDLPLAVIDTETTGIEEDDRVCEIAAVRFESGIPVSRFSSLVNPGRPIPEAVSKVHGIKDVDVASKPTLPEVAGELLRVCQGAVAVAYSANFDRRMLHAEITGTDCHAFDPSQSWVDVLVLVRHFDRNVRGKGKNKLEKACERHGVILEGAHRALADALACGGLLHAFKSRLGNVSAAQLIERCDIRRTEQDADFQAWLSRQQGQVANG